MDSSNNNFSLYELNEHLKRVVAFNMRQLIWVRCEVAEVSNSKGNIFLSLVQRDDFELKAKTNAMIWRKDLTTISQKVGDSLWSILQVGREVLLQVQVEFHEFHGLKLLIKNLDPTVTIGQLELQRLQALKKLETEQFTKLNKRLASPLVWQRLAIISSSNAAGLQDFKMQLKKNSYQYHFECELFESAMQGVNLPHELMLQLQKIEKREADFDAIVIVRGGGARLDLMGFDDYQLCVAIATSALPVITGIGHDIDETLADLVAHTTLKTPTAAADFLIEQSLRFESEIEQLNLRIQKEIKNRISLEYNKVALLKQQIKNTVTKRLDKEKQVIATIQQKIDLLNPSRTLQRGFVALLDEKGSMLNSVEQLEKGKTYSLQLADGKVEITLK